MPLKRNLSDTQALGWCWLNTFKKDSKILFYFSEGQRERYVFGTYQNGPIKDFNKFQGDLTGFMFSIEPNVRFMTTDRGEGGKNYFLVNSAD